MANRKEYEMLFQLNAQLGSSYGSTFSKAQQHIASMQKEIQSLSKTQGDIAAFQKQQQAIENTQKKMAMLQQQYDNIQKEIKETEGYSSSLENKLLSKQQQIDKTAASLEQYTQRLNEMDEALKAAGVDTSNLTGESAKLNAQIGALKDQQEQAADEANTFGAKSAAAFGTVQQAIAAAGIVTALKEIADAYMECVDIAGDFEEGMSNVEALSGATADEMALLAEKAKELGATTKYTAQESADAMGYMAMAGWNAQEMLAGMDGVINLAAASGEDLAMVSDIVTDNLTAFGLTAADTAHFADVLAAAATSSNTNVSIMGETFKQSASIAGALGYSIEDVAVAVGLMANSGVKGSIAGTALKNTFNGLLEGVTLTASAFGEYDYTAIKADGTMKTFSETIDELRDCFEQMTEAERVNNAMALAGQRGYNGLLAILNATDEDYASLTDSINNCTGAAKRMADIKMDNLNGDLELMNGAWEALQNTIGEQFIPEMRTLYQLGEDIGDSLNEFVQEHPALMKALAAFLAIIMLVVTGLTGFVAVTKILIPLMGLLTASIPGVNIIMGVAAGVAAITAAVVGFVSAANEGVPSVKELTDAARGLGDALEDADKSYQTSATDIAATAAVADTYISRLEALETVTDRTDEQQTEWHNTLALLANAIPELAEYIDLTNDTIDGGTAALRANTEAWKQNAEAQAYQEYLNSVMEQYNGVMSEAAANSIKLTQAQVKLDKAEQTHAELTKRVSELMNEAKDKAAAFYDEYGYGADATNFLTEEYYGLLRTLNETDKEMRTQQRTIKNLNKAMEEDADALAEAETAMNDAREAVALLTGETEGSAAAAEAAAAQQRALSSTVNDVMLQVNDLADAYADVYAEAKQSVEGQYKLWDDAEQVVATSAWSINHALESQVSYWQSYNDNLSTLTLRSSEIEGLSEMISSFADGSADSVNAVAGMATASDDQLRKMVENWKTLQEEQDKVSGSIADLKTDFTATMDELQAQLAADIDAMDLGDEAAESGKATIQGFITGANGMLPQVQSAYERIAQAAIDAIDAKLDIHSPSRVMMEKANMTWEGYIRETEAMRPKLEEAMMLTAGAGIDAVSEEDMQIIALAPKLLSAISAASRGADMDGAGFGTGSGGSSISVTFEIQGNATPETVSDLREFGEDFAARVLEVIEDADIDTSRRKYR